MAERKIVIVDLDGTLADVSHRLPYIRGRRKNWKRFFQLMHEDKPVAIVRDWVRKLSAEFEIVIITGRPDVYRKVTEEWLRQFEVPYDHIFMRQPGDHRPDYIVKRELLNKLDRSRVAFVIDDRREVCDMFRSCGLKVFQVRAGEEY